LVDYLPYVETITVRATHAPRCRDPADQIFVDLATQGRTDILVTGDEDLLLLNSQTTFSIEKPAQYQRRFPTEAR
jgi:predicted nucleic acid-binding protein